jgi:hypothetical protein
MQHLFGKILLVITGMLAGLLVAEGVARLLPPPYGSSGEKLFPMVECCGELGWVGRPGYEQWKNTGGRRYLLKFNSQGMHDREHSFAKPGGVFRILLLGDSFIQAIQLPEEETSPQVLDRLLNGPGRAGERRFEVIGASVMGWGTVQELLYYRQQGYRYNADLVILAFYTGNDLLNNMPGQLLTNGGFNCYFPYFVICDGKLDPEPWLFAPGFKATWGGQCPPGRKQISYLLGTLYQHSRLYAQLEPIWTNRHRDRPGFALPVAEFLPGIDDPALDYSWQLTKELILQLRRETEAHGAKLAVVIIGPAAVFESALMSPEERESFLQKVPHLRGAEPDLPNKTLTEFLQEQKIPVLDLQPPMLDYVREVRSVPYLPNEGHWNAEGNRLAAELMYNWLIQSGLAPAAD